ncbi:MAG: efflux RND transporter periplasmic adaptor subunit [Aquabacterium sp.]|uniref:efflux RND transporter periplasmic adaptor subunit n=1 Tax=Aquabacterium sp. TaxID=1872578 RepID=UPI003BB16648
MSFLKPLMTLMASASVLASAHAEVMGCLVEPDRVADVGSQFIGVLERMLVERGDQVVSGQVLARLSAQVERASVSIAEARSEADAELRQAIAAAELAQRKWQRAKDLLKQEFVSDQAVDQADAEYRVAEQRVSQARESQKVAQREYRLSAAQLGQRDVRSPFDGIVIERYRTEGERIEREPVVRVARIDPLRVEAIVPASQFGSIAMGQVATIRTDLPNFNALSAKVVLVDRVIDPASNSFRVRLTLPNPDNRIPSGLRCRVDFASSLPPAAPSAPAQPGAVTPTKAPLPAKPPKTLPTPVAATQPTRVQQAVSPQTVPDQARPVSQLSTRLATASQAPERMLVKQYLTSKEPRLSMSSQLSVPRLSSLDTDRPLLSLR